MGHHPLQSGLFLVLLLNQTAKNQLVQYRGYGLFRFAEIKYFRAISAHCEQAAPAWNMVPRLFWDLTDSDVLIGSEADGYWWMQITH